MCGLQTVVPHCTHLPLPATHTVSGNLTMKGITKNIEFPTGITFNENSVEATAKFNINRKQWDIVYLGQPDDLVKDDIHLGILLKASK